MRKQALEKQPQCGLLAILLGAATRMLSSCTCLRSARAASCSAQVTPMGYNYLPAVAAQGAMHGIFSQLASEVQALDCWPVLRGHRCVLGKRLV